MKSEETLDLACVYTKEDPFTCDLYRQPLYPGANSSVLEVLAKQFKLFVSHPGATKQLLSDQLSLFHSVLPEGTTFPDSYSKAKQLISDFLADPVVYHVCPNDCIIFRGSYKDDHNCPKCAADRYNIHGKPLCKFIYMPIGSKLARMYANKDLAKMLQCHQLRDQLGEVQDIHDSKTWKTLYAKDADFSGDKRGVSLAFCNDGVNPFHHNHISYSMLPLMLPVLNLPKNVRHKFQNVILAGIIPSNKSKEPKDLSCYLQVLVDEIQALQGKNFFDAYTGTYFALQVKIVSFVMDYPGMCKCFNISGSGAYQGCMWCHICGEFIF